MQDLTEKSVLHMWVYVCRYFLLKERSWSVFSFSSVSFSGTVLTMNSYTAVSLTCLVNVCSTGYHLSGYFMQVCLHAQSFSLLSLDDCAWERGATALLCLFPASGQCCPCCGKGDCFAQEEFIFHQCYGGTTTGDQERRHLSE